MSNLNKCMINDEKLIVIQQMSLERLVPFKRKRQIEAK